MAALAVTPWPPSPTTRTSHGRSVSRATTGAPAAKVRWQAHTLISVAAAAGAGHGVVHVRIVHLDVARRR